MSRTDKTKPFIVKLWHGDLARQAHHRHTVDSVCDLPRSLEEALTTGGRERCYWDFRWTGVSMCCCGLCRDRRTYRRAVRGARTRDTARLAAGVDVWNAGDIEAFDDIEPALRYRW
jgi:hypothetical protein